MKSIKKVLLFLCIGFVITASLSFRGNSDDITPGKAEGLYNERDNNKNSNSSDWSLSSNKYYNGYHEVKIGKGWTYKGYWSDGYMNGNGHLIRPDGYTRYIGEFNNNTFDGYGKLYWVKDRKLELEYEGYFKNNEYHGEGEIYGTCFSENTNSKYDYRVSKGKSINGLKDGLWINKDCNGKIYSKINYKNGVENGYSYHYKNGLLTTKNFYVSGFRKFFNSYYNNGELRCKIEYKDEKTIYYHEYYLQNGEQTLKNGNGIFYNYYNDKLLSKINYTNGKKDGISEWYHYPNGQLEQRIEYIYNAELNKSLKWNVLETFDENGNIRNGGTLKNGNGILITYDSDGKSEISRYENGLEIGVN